jgi:hypothetical protein
MLLYKGPSLASTAIAGVQSALPGVMLFEGNDLMQRIFCYLVLIITPSVFPFC